MSAISAEPEKARLSLSTDARWCMAIAALTVAGAGLRVAAARGDLWLDEIWSFRLVETVPDVWSVFFALPFDNNHPLNSVWLMLVGPNASPLLVRALSILFGTLSIPVAARLGRRRSPAAGIILAAIVAFGEIFVEYGSEARGYAGMLLAMLLALDSLEAHFESPQDRAPLWAVAGAIAFGTLSQLSMIAMTGILGATALVRSRMLAGGVREAIKRSTPVLSALVRGTMPGLICCALSVLHGSLHTGIRSPFTWSQFSIGMARMIDGTIGLPDSQAAGWSGIVVIGALALAAFTIAALPAERRVFPALAIFGLPLVQVLLGIPNEQYARFHLISCIGLVVLIAEVGSLALSSRSTARPVAIAILALSLAGSTIGDARLIRDGRGSFAKPVAIMGAQGPASVIVRPAILAGETGGVVRWYADRLNAPVRASNTPCPSNADWLLVVREPGDALDAPPQDLGDTPDCRARFVPHSAYPAYGLSGFTWLLFRRETR